MLQFSNSVWLSFSSTSCQRGKEHKLNLKYVHNLCVGSIAAVKLVSLGLSNSIYKKKIRIRIQFSLLNHWISFIDHVCVHIYGIWLWLHGRRCFGSKRLSEIFQNVINGNSPSYLQSWFQFSIGEVNWHEPSSLKNKFAPPVDIIFSFWAKSGSLTGSIFFTADLAQHWVQKDKLTFILSLFGQPNWKISLTSLILILFYLCLHFGCLQWATTLDWKVKPMYKCLKLAVFLIYPARGKLLWLQK